VFAIAVGSEAPGKIEPCLAAGDHVNHSGGEDRTGDLCDHVLRNIAPGEPAPYGEAKGDRGIQMAARDVADRVGHRQHRKAKG